MFTKKATKVDEIFTVDLTLTACQIGGEDFLNFCGLLRKHDFTSSLLSVYCQSSEVSTKPPLLPCKVSNKTKLQMKSQEGLRP